MLKISIRMLASVTFAAVLGVAAQASAIDYGMPVPGFDTDSGVERFKADGLVFAVELMDSPGGSFGEFGIYYDRDTRITLFGADDMGAGQAAMVDLVGGSVMDVDSLTYDFFDARSGSFGFYFEDDGVVTYSENHLNAGDGPPTSIGTYESLYSPLEYLITLERWEVDLNRRLALEVVGGIRPAHHSTNAVPEPSGAMLFAMGALVMRGAVRRQRS